MKKRCIFIIILLIICTALISLKQKNKYLIDEQSVAIFIDGSRSDSFPAKGTVAFEKADCDTNASIYWDKDTWGLYATNLNEKTKCNLYFKTLENAITKITNLASTDTVNISTDDPDNNIRYIGANPNNYVYFNCNDYNNQNSETCELWRIIGVFNNIEKEDGTKENLIKIVRNESIGEYSWDNKDLTTNAESNNGKNDWQTSRLNYLLNPGHESELIGGSLYYYGKKGNCYSGQNNSTKTCDFNTVGLKNDNTRSSIETIVWNIGGSKNYNNVKAEEFYALERGDVVYDNRPTTWIGNIGLMYPSDYGYATKGGLTTDRSSCLSYALNEWGSDSVSECRNNNYLFNNKSSWFLTHNASFSASILFISYLGNQSSTSAFELGIVVQPTLFLKSDISIGVGDGTEASPYQLNI